MTNLLASADLVGTSPEVRRKELLRWGVEKESTRGRDSMLWCRL